MKAISKTALDVSVLLSHSGVVGSLLEHFGIRYDRRDGMAYYLPCPMCCNTAVLRFSTDAGTLYAAEWSCAKGCHESRYPYIVGLINAHCAHASIDDTLHEMYAWLADLVESGRISILERRRVRELTTLLGNL